MTALTQLHDWLSSARAYLDGLYPGLSSALLAIFAVAAVWLLKRVRPDLFAKLPPSVQALPALFVAGVLSALTAAEPTLAALLSNFLGGAAVGGSAAVGAHHMLKASPLPYGKRPLPRASTLALFLVCAPAAVLATVFGFALAFALSPVACSPKTVADVVEVADDVLQVAKVLCLADQKQAHAAPSSREFAGLCQTVAQLAPYVPAAEHPMIAAALARRAEPSDGGAP